MVKQDASILIADCRLAAGAIIALQAEVNALRAESARFKVDGIHTCHAECPRWPCVLRRENDALRARVAVLEQAGRMLNEAIDSGRHMIPDDDEGLAAKIFAYRINVAQTKYIRAALKEPTP